MTAPTAFRIVVSADCNLRCTYCSTNCGRYDGQAGRMDDRTLAASARFIAETERFQGNVQLVHSGGEPLLHLDAIEALMAAVRERLPAHREVSLALATNGTLVDDHRARRLLALGCQPEFSIDGTAAIHDRCRVFHDGRGSHAQAVRGLNVWRRMSEAAGRPRRVSVRATVPAGASLSEVMRFFDELGVDEVTASPVQKSTWELDAAHGGTARFAEEFLDEARRYMAHHTPRSLLDSPPRLKTLGIMLTALVFDTVPDPHCGIGRTVFAIDRHGGVWPCDAFIGLDESFRLGDVWQGIDATRLAHLETRLDSYHAGCRGCEAESRCGELCLAQALCDTDGRLTEPTSWCRELRRIYRELEELTRTWRAP